MADPVCIATRVDRGNGLILRWYSDTDHYGWRQQIVTATAAGVRHHAWQHEIPDLVRVDAQLAYLLMCDGDNAGAEAFATHRVQRFLGWRRLVPIPAVTGERWTLTDQVWADLRKEGGR